MEHPLLAVYSWIGMQRIVVLVVVEPYNCHTLAFDFDLAVVAQLDLVAAVLEAELVVAVVVAIQLEELLDGSSSAVQVWKIG